MIATATEASTVKFLVNGHWEEAAGRALHPIINPATGEVLAQVPYATEADIDRTARAAHEAFLKWREVPVVDRVQVPRMSPRR
jgi:malonate-semialdehyde dehydrogenase (acetylating)/methylmalonate-semialdehyde dehydrogenase